MVQARLPTPTDVLDALPVAVVLVDPAFRISGWNTAAEVLYGHPAADAVGSPALDVLFEQDDRAGAEALLSTAARGEPWEGDHRVRRRDGVLLVSSFRAVPLGSGAGLAWIATDGMDQGLAEQERAILLSAEHAARATAEEALGLVEAILTSAPVGIAVFGLDLRYTRVNEAYAALSGIPAAEHVGGRVGEVVPLPSQVGADLRRVVTTGRTIMGRAVELPDGRRPGDTRHFTVSYFPIRSTTGVLVGAGATVIDVTEGRRAEAERAALLRRAEIAQERLAILATASTVLTTTMDLDELLRRLAGVLTPGAADWCIIELFDPAGHAEHVAVSHLDRGRADELAARLRSTPLETKGGGVIAEVVRTGQARLVEPDAAADALRDAARDRGQPALADEFSVRSSVIVPIEAHGHALGVLVLSTEGQRTLDEEDLDLAVEVAHRAALAVGNARAYQQEHEIADLLQRALLPSTVPRVPGIDVAVRYVGAGGASIGGDWYDVIAFAEGPVGLVVGDVVGHDIAASTSMGQVRSALRAYASEDHASPGAALARVDRLFASLDLTYATCFLGVLDPATLDLRWSNAGHPPPLLLRDGEASYLSDGLGVMLGVTSGATAAEASTQLRAEDVLILYTDGLVERRGESLTDGFARLAETAAGLVAGDAEHLCDELLDRLVPSAQARDDDVALLVVRVRADDDITDGHRLHLAVGAESAAVARGFTAGVLEQAGWHDVLDTAVLLTSELVTNAVRHGRPPYTLVVSVSDTEVEVGVEDAEDAVPTRRGEDQLAEGGRGLVLVDALAEAWGTRPRRPGKTTWFTVRRDRPV